MPSQSLAGAIHRRTSFPIALIFTAITICVGSASPCRAAINPADPGLADAKAYGQEKIPNNGASALCVECHTENPQKGFGTHFVLNRLSGELRQTNSGGGWKEGAWGVRDEGQFFKIRPWLVTEGGNGGTSKYGEVDTWLSVMFIGSDPVLAAEACRPETTSANMAKMEMICESCHSVRVNVLGRYNLLATPTDSLVMDDFNQGRITPLCVGCHGFLYQDDGGAANGLNANWTDVRNFSEITGQRRGNNEVHYVRGQRYPRNHHVMTGDAIDLPLVQAKLLVRDVETMDPLLIEKPIRTDSRKGTMPVRLQPQPPMILSADPTALHCLNCHQPAHKGEPSMGAAIVTGQELGGKDTGFGIDRISDGKAWGKFSDAKFCILCHE
jgi:hypothetical protein